MNIITYFENLIIRLYVKIMYNLDYRNLPFKQMIDDIVIDL